MGEPLEHTSRVVSVDYSGDGSRIATSTTAGAARVWDAATFRSIGPTFQHDDRVSVVKFSPDGSLASLSHEGGTSNGITLLDMSNPFSPSVITQFSALLEPSTNNSVHNIWLEQNYAYIANSITNLLRVVDISNPFAPVTVASRNFGAGPSPALRCVVVGLDRAATKRSTPGRSRRAVVRAPPCTTWPTTRRM